MSEPSPAVRTLRFLYTTFWKPIFMVASVLLMACGILILKWVWTEPPFYVGVFVVLIAVSVAYVAVEVFGRAVGGNEGPVFPLHERRTLLFLGGYGLALALTAGLAYNEISDRHAAERSAENARLEQAKLNAMSNDPNVRRGAELLQRRRATTTPGSGGDE